MAKGHAFDVKLAETLIVRDRVKREFLPLFDHLINLARDSSKHGRAQRAGRELKAARDLIRKYGER